MKLRVLPDCPKCQEDELFLRHGKEWTVIRCYLCGWNYTIIPKPADDAIEAAVAEAVRRAGSQSSPPIAS